MKKERLTYGEILKVCRETNLTPTKFSLTVGCSRNYMSYLKGQAPDKKATSGTSLRVKKVYGPELKAVRTPVVKGALAEKKVIIEKPEVTLKDCKVKKYDQLVDAFGEGVLENMLQLKQTSKAVNHELTKLIFA